MCYFLFHQKIIGAKVEKQDLYLYKNLPISNYIKFFQEKKFRYIFHNFTQSYFFTLKVKQKTVFFSWKLQNHYLFSSFISV